MGLVGGVCAVSARLHQAPFYTVGAESEARAAQTRDSRGVRGLTTHAAPADQHKGVSLSQSDTPLAYVSATVVGAFRVLPLIAITA